MIIYHLHEVVGRCSETQFHVGENLNDLTLGVKMANNTWEYETCHDSRHHYIL